MPSCDNKKIGDQESKTKECERIAVECLSILRPIELAHIEDGILRGINVAFGLIEMPHEDFDAWRLGQDVSKMNLVYIADICLRAKCNSALLDQDLQSVLLAHEAVLSLMKLAGVSRLGKNDYYEVRNASAAEIAELLADETRVQI